MNRKACSRCLFAAFLASLAVARAGRAERLPIRTYTTADGLPSTFVQCIRRDSRGFLWFCTRNGLSRFDGQRFVTYGVDDGLPAATINDLLEARDGTIWVATNGGGVCRFRPAPSEVTDKPAQAGVTGSSARSSGRRSLFTAYTVGESRISNRVNALHQDRAGRLWAGTDAGLFRLVDSNGATGFQPVPLGSPATHDSILGITALAGDPNGDLWIGTGVGLIRRLSDGRTIHYTSAPTGMDRIHAVLTDPDGILWAATDAGILVLRLPLPTETGLAGRRSAAQVLHPVAVHSRVRGVQVPTAAGDAVRYTTADGLVNDAVRSFHRTSDGRLWISTSGGLTEFSAGRFRGYTKEHGLSFERIETLADDGEGNLWIATFGAGVMKLMLNGFVTFDLADGLGDPRIHSIFSDEAGNTVVVNGEWVVSRFDGNRFRSGRPVLPDGSHLRWASPHGFLDHAGQLWMFSNRGLFRYGNAFGRATIDREHPVAAYGKHNGLPADAVNRVFEDSRGDLWISVADDKTALVRRDRATGHFHIYTPADGFSAPFTPLSYASAFAEDRAGHVWIGFDAGGLVRYAEGRFTSFGEADGVPPGRIMALHVDRRGRLWVGGNEGGLARLDDPAAAPVRFTRYTTAQGLASNNVRCIAEDAWNRVYAGTGGGVDRLDPATGRVRHFTTAEGLASDFVTAAFADPAGRLWFGTLNGLSQLVPVPDRPRPSPPIRISGVQFSDVDYPLSAVGDTELSGIQVAAAQNRVRFDFFGLGFAMGEALRYQFKLEGIDARWGTPTDQRSAYYPRLPAGTYRFAVRALGADGTPSAVPAVVAFTIRPPIWRQPWFVSLAGLLVSLLLFGLYRYRLAQLLEIERVRTRLATDLHDDIGSNLSQIAILSEVLLQEGASRNPQSANLLSLIMTASRESVDSLSDIVWAINPRRDSLRDLTQRMRRFASDTLAARSIDFTFKASDGDDLAADANLRQQVFLIFKESVSNVARHSNCTQATIDFGVEGACLVLRVSDNGKGLDPAASTNGNGLTSMRERARAVGGDFRLTVEPGVGTAMVLRVPLKRHRRWSAP